MSDPHLAHASRPRARLWGSLTPASLSFAQNRCGSCDVAAQIADRVPRAVLDLDASVDKVVSEMELFQLPAPLFETPDGFTRAVLFAHKRLTAMEKPDRIRACYLRACLRHVMRLPVTNASIRQRFGISENNSAMASRLINEAIEDGMVVIRDVNVGTKSRRYLPYWAAPNPQHSGGIA